MQKKLPLPEGPIALGSLIDEARRARGLTMERLGNKANVHRSHVSRIAAGDFKTVSRNVVRICNVLQIDPRSVDLQGDPLRSDLVREVEAGLVKAGRKRAAYASAVIAIARLFS